MHIGSPHSIHSTQLIQGLSTSGSEKVKIWMKVLIIDPAVEAKLVEFSKS
jgi:hypothetical protein